MRGKRHRQSKSSNHLVKPNSSFCNLSHPSHPFTSDFLNLSESFRIFLRPLNSLSICRLWYMLTYIICITHILYSLSIWFPGFRSRLKFWKTSCRRWAPCRILNLSLSMCVQFGPDPMELENWVWDTWDLRFEIRLLEGLCETCVVRALEAALLESPRGWRGRYAVTPLLTGWLFSRRSPRKSRWSRWLKAPEGQHIMAAAARALRALGSWRSMPSLPFSRFSWHQSFVWWQPSCLAGWVLGHYWLLLLVYQFCALSLFFGLCAFMIQMPMTM